MNKLQMPVSIGVIGALAGAVIAEFFPRLFQSGLAGAIGGAVSEPFSGYRNELALKYALAGLVIGAVLGLVLMVLKGKK
jgi:hypothetical protein